MPYFNWVGIDMMGVVHKGRLFAGSQEKLDALLLRQHIALLSCSSKKYWGLKKRVSLSLKVQFFRQLTDLIGAGVLVPDALLLLNAQIHHPLLQEVIAGLAQQVFGGASLHHALQQYPAIFDSIMIHLVQVGEESGHLHETLLSLTKYLEIRYEFKKKLRAALFVPLCTMIFFALILVIMMTVIVPRFMAIFESMKAELPPLTKALIWLSGMCTSGYGLIAGIVLFGGVLLLARLYRVHLKTRAFFDHILLQVPYVNSLFKETALSYFLHGVSVLLGSGMRLVPALTIARSAITNKTLAASLLHIEQEVLAGDSLSQAMLHDKGQIFDADAIAMVAVGEESGKLPLLLGQVAQLYHERINRMLTIITTLINPLLMIVLGLLVALLIFAIYLPIFTLSDVVTQRI